ncbi:hypothetical protein BGZ65_009196 [Modicella reniformis]|uniref:RTA1-domain-containing protein n=1 Tax=Modicella reniformis TaxID=1440133 RepID=A0A9P6J4G6_9FUNG|nr:hypothetical protein BGZ65_009196 [Modicella reniformis]
MSSRRVLLLLVQALLIWDAVLAQSPTTNTTNPASGNQRKRSSIMKYEPSVPGNIIFGGLYMILGLIFSYHVYKNSDKWAICLPIGAIASSLGFFIKITIDPMNLKLMTYIIQNAFIVISPTAFLAFNYMLYGRFITAIDPKFDIHNIKAGSKMEKSRFSFIPPRIVGRTFVWSDIITFLIQMAAGGLQAGGGTKGDAKMSELGFNLFLAAVIIQGISYCLFTVLLLVAVKKLIEERRKSPSMRGNGWMGLDSRTTLIVAQLFVSSIFIIIRSIFRIVEYAGGYDGYLANEEVYLFVLDAAPLVIAIGVFAFIWPPVLLSTIAAQTRQAEQNYSMETTSSAPIPIGQRSDHMRLV